MFARFKFYKKIFIDRASLCVDIAKTPKFQKNVKSVALVSVFSCMSYGMYRVFDVNEVEKNDLSVIYKTYDRGQFYLPDKNNYSLEERMLKNNEIIKKGRVKNKKNEGVWYFKHYNSESEEYELFNNFIDGNISSISTKKNYHNKKLVSETAQYDSDIISQRLYNQKGLCTSLPDGEIIVWKPCKHYPVGSNVVVDEGIYVFVKLRVPANSRRVTPFSLSYMPTHRGRIEDAIVDDIIDENGKKYDSAISFSFNNYDNNNYNNKPKFIFLRDKQIKSVPYNQNPNENNSFSNASGLGISVNLYKEDCDKWMIYD